MSSMRMSGFEWMIKFKYILCEMLSNRRQMNIKKILHIPALQQRCDGFKISEILSKLVIIIFKSPDKQDHESEQSWDEINFPIKYDGQFW